MDKCTIETAKDLINEFCMREFEQPADFTNLAHVDIAYTTDPVTDLPIQIYLDLVGYQIISECDGKVVRRKEYTTVEDFCQAIAQIEFDSVVALSDEEIAIAVAG